MTIKFSKAFKKQYKLLPTRIQQQFDRRLLLWQEDPTNRLLNVHQLKGALSDFYSMNVTGDVRALSQAVEGWTYIYQFIGTHAELYVK